MKRYSIYPILVWLVLISTVFSSGEGTTWAVHPIAPMRQGSIDPPENYYVESSTIGSLSIHSGTLFFTTLGGCPGGEFAEPCNVRSMPGHGPATPTTHYADPAGPVIRSNLTVDETHVYWLNSLSQVVRLPRSARSPARPEVVSNRENGHLSEITVDPIYVYWLDNTNPPGVTGDVGKLYRAPKAGGARELMVTQNRTTFWNLKTDGLGRVFYQSNNVNDFLNLANVLNRVTHTEFGFTVTPGPAKVKAYTLDETTVYYAIQLGPSWLHLESAPLDDFDDITPGPDIDDAQYNDVDEMAISGTKLFWRPNAGGAGPIFRLALGGAPTAITPSLADISNLVASTRFLFWIAQRGANTIYRLPVNAAEQQVDLSVAEIEITQGIQNLDNEVPLIQGKPALVRVYPGLAGFPDSSLPVFVQLHGSRDGSPLPGSPLPWQTVRAKPDGADRASLGDTANFQLPLTWLHGDVTLRAEIRTTDFIDTDLANNARTLTGSFMPKANICIKFLPILTTSALTYYAYRDYRFNEPSTTLMNILNRFNTLWGAGRPVWYTTRVVIRKPGFFQPPNPFDMINAADKDWVIAALWEHNVYDEAPGWCTRGGARTHYVAMVHPAINTGITLGSGALWDVLSWIRMDGGNPTAHNLPIGGTTLVHEIAHNHNSPFGDAWKHVNCGLPAGDDFHDAYPYDPRTIGPTGPRTFWGFDHLSRSVIRPEEASDYMSYCGPKWVSDYNWRRSMDVTGNLSVAAMAAEATEGLSAIEQLLLLGRVDRNESRAEFISAQRLPAEMVPAEAVVETPATHSEGVSAAYEVQLLNASGSVLATKTVILMQGTHEGEEYLFMAALPFPPGTVQIRLVRNGSPLTAVPVSPASPQVDGVQARSDGQGGLRVNWIASDADSSRLKYSVQYSSDNGSTWILLTSNHPETSLHLENASDLAGSASALVRVIASDGVNTGMSTSAPFNLENHAPIAIINTPLDGTAIETNEPVHLEGYALDPEIGLLEGNAYTWQLTGPVSRSAAGEEWTLHNLPPGRYTARLTAADPEGLESGAEVRFTVAPKRVYDAETPPNLDGYCDDPSYAADRNPITLRDEDGRAASVYLARFLAGNQLYACFEGLNSTGLAGESAALEFDLDNSGNEQMTAADRVFLIRPNGEYATGVGNGSGGQTMDAFPQGLAGAVSQSEGTWNAEMRIDVAALGGWGRMVGMQASHLTGASWPSPSEFFSPRTWGLAALGPQGQTIDFPPPGDQQLEEGIILLEGSASSGLPLSYESRTPEVCSAVGREVILLKFGTCTILASQPGNGSFSPAAPVTRSFQVISSPQSHQLYLPFLKR